MEPETIGEPVQEETVTAKNFFSRLGGVFFSPREAFTEIGKAPRLVIPIIALFLVSAFNSWYLMQKIDARETARIQIEQAVRQGQITEDQMNQQLALISATTGPVLAIVGGVGTLFLCFVIAGYGKLFSMTSSAENSYKSLLEVSVYAMLVVGIVSAVLLIIILQIRGPGRIDASNISSVVSSNLGAWITSIAGADALPRFIMRLAGAVDIFNIWIIAILSIGFSAVSKKLKTATAAMWLVSIYVIFSIISAAVSSMFGQ